MNMASKPSRIFHIALLDEWGKALEQGSYVTGSIESEGFIHFSTGKQLLRTANKYYAGRHDAVLLVVDPTKLAPELKYEPIADGQLFPHLYGPLNLDAVLMVLTFHPEADGSFTWPESLEYREDEL